MEASDVSRRIMFSVSALAFAIIAAGAIYFSVNSRPLDALPFAYGVVLALAVNYFKENVQMKKVRKISLVLGVFLLFAGILELVPK